MIAYHANGAESVISHVTYQMDGTESVILRVAYQAAGTESCFSHVAYQAAGTESCFSHLPYSATGTESVISHVADHANGTESAVLEVAYLAAGTESAVLKVAHQHGAGAGLHGLRTGTARTSVDAGARRAWTRARDGRNWALQRRRARHRQSMTHPTTERPIGVDRERRRTADKSVRRLAILVCVSSACEPPTRLYEPIAPYMPNSGMYTASRTTTTKPARNTMIAGSSTASAFAVAVSTSLS